MSIEFGDNFAFAYEPGFYLEIENGSNVTVNTWGDWHLIPSTKIVIVPPKPKTTYVDIPGADGGVDLTNYQTGFQHFNYREGTLEFIACPYNGYHTNNWLQREREVSGFLANGEIKLKLYDPSIEANRLYKGRMWIDSWEIQENWAYVTFGYKLNPYWIPTVINDWNNTPIVSSKGQNMNQNNGTDGHSYIEIDLGDKPVRPIFNLKRGESSLTGNGTSTWNDYRWVLLDALFPEGEGQQYTTNGVTFRRGLNSTEEGMIFVSGTRSKTNITTSISATVNGGLVPAFIPLTFVYDTGSIKINNTDISSKCYSLIINGSDISQTSTDKSTYMMKNVNYSGSEIKEFYFFQKSRVILGIPDSVTESGTISGYFKLPSITDLYNDTTADIHNVMITVRDDNGRHHFIGKSTADDNGYNNEAPFYLKGKCIISAYARNEYVTCTVTEPKFL